MRPHQIFQNISPELAHEIFGYLRSGQKEVYATTVASLASARKLRPVFVTKKRPAEQYDWLHKTSKLKLADGIGEHVLQIWLLHAHKPMLVEFLNALGIEHDGEGQVDDLPESLDKEKLSAAIDALLEKHPEEVVKVYLHVFNLQTENGWEELSGLLANDDRVKLTGAAVA